MPHGLELVIDYVNTLDIEEQTDAISAPEQLGAWLAEHHVLAAGTRVSQREHAGALRLREALRALMLANNEGAPGPDAAWAEIERAAREGDLGVHFEPREGVQLAPGREGAAGAIAQLLVPLAAAIGDGSWARVKACRAADCEWAFYDRSRNRSGVWCEMAVCGNRTKVRAYRTRESRR